MMKLDEKGLFYAVLPWVVGFEHDDGMYND
jgi:hypothetical protein